MKMKIKPLKVGRSFEPCLIEFETPHNNEFYPSAVVHVDTFFEIGNNEVYNLLRSGKVVILEVNLSPVECEE